MNLVHVKSGTINSLNPGMPSKLSRTTSFFDVNYTPPPTSSVSSFHGYHLAIPSPTSSTMSTSTASLSPSHTSNPSLSAALPPAVFSRSFKVNCEAGGSSSARNGYQDGVLPRWDDSEDAEGAVQLRFVREDKERYYLGAGRYSRVYLASYRVTQGASSGAGDVPLEHTAVPWKVCAVKVMEKDDESQALGRREAWFLRHLAEASRRSNQIGRHSIVTLFGVKREEEGGEPQKTFFHARTPSLPITPLVSIPRHTRYASLDSPIAHTPLPAHHLQHPSSLLLLLEYAPTTLADVLHRHPRLLTQQTYLKIAVQLAQAISFLHSETILHTDLKPQNILLTSTLDVRVADFNTALHLASLPSPPIDPVGLGTPVYSPPEFNKPPPSAFGFPADIWMFGVLMMVTLVGREPYARLLSGRRSKGGGGRHELKLWLGKGAYWAWEERERLEALEDSGLNDHATAHEEPHLARLGREELQKLGVRDQPLGITEIDDAQVPAVKLGSLDTGAKHGSPESYQDGSPPIFYPGSATERVPQKCCSANPAQRPQVEVLVEVLERELQGL